MIQGHEPVRLLHEQYMPLASQVRIFKHVVAVPLAVHWHEFYELALITGGSGIHVLNGVATRLGRGSIFLLSPADFHELVPDDGAPLTLYNLIFTQPFLRPELFHKMFQDRTNPYTAELDERRFQAVEPEFARMWDESNESLQAHSDWVVQGALERVLIDLLRLCGGAGTSSYEALVIGVHPSVREAVTYIQHHFREPLTLGNVARHAGLSANYFSECFSKQVGVPFQTYLLERRLQFASALLRTTSLSVTEIGLAAGFGTLNHFDRCFKKRFGDTPRRVRK